MRALTISQPWASMIANGRKWVENRTWESLYRGPLLIHAGKGTQYGTRQEFEAKGYPLGAVIAVCNLCECYHVPTLREKSERELKSSELAVLSHEYTEGPFAFVLENVRKLAAPVPWAGCLWIWSPPAELLRLVDQQL
jgi:hypothetical protein